MKQRWFSALLALCMLLTLAPTVVLADESPTEINTVADLKAFRDAVNGGHTYSGETVTLNANLDLSGENWTPIGNSSYAFQGTFDGHKHIIYNLTINTSSQYCGLFGRINGATIQNLGVEGAQVVSSHNDAAALVGNAQGGTIERCYVTGSVTGQGAVSGILGSTYSSSYTTNVSNCYARVVLTHTGYTDDIAGISGWNEATSVKITNCYSACTGEVRPIAGWSDGSAVSKDQFVRTYFDATLSPDFSESSGRTDLGKTSDQLKTKSTFTGWDFAGTWAIDATKNGGYPYLQGFTPGLGGAPGSVSVTLTDGSSPVTDATVVIKEQGNESDTGTTLGHQGSGVYSGAVPTTGKTYDVYVDGEKKGDVTQSGSAAATVSFTVSTAHTHGEGCYASTLICEQEEHTHTEGCYTAGEEPEAAEAPTAPTPYDAAVAALRAVLEADEAGADFDTLAGLLQTAIDAVGALEDDEAEYDRFYEDEDCLALLAAALELQGRLDEGASVPEALGDTHDHSGWTEWSTANALPTTAGSYYLATDVKLSSQWSVPSGVTNLCLNGHSITQNGSYSYVVYICSSTLNLYDCKGGGKITHSSGKTGGGVFMNGGRFTMSGTAAISGNTDSGESKGGGVYVVSGEFTMSGGTISDNTAGTNGGGVFVISGAFEMSGGTISDNTASSSGGGVYVTSSSTFTMTGGTISGNTASSFGGGGVYVASGAFEMSGGSILSNTTSGSGGGVYVSNGGTFNMSGNPVISGNTKDGSANNVYLDSSKTITVSGALTEGASIGVTTKDDPSSGNVAVATGSGYTITTYDLARFSSDVNKVLVLEDSKIQVTPANTHTYTVTLNANSGTINAGNVTSYTYGVGATLPTNVTRTGYDFDGWYDNSGLTGSAVTSISTTDTGNKTYYAKWTTNSYTISYTLDGGTVTTANPTSYNVESAAFTLNNPTKTGYTFAGWTGTGLDGASTSVTVSKGSTGDRSYTATWTLNPPTVTISPNPAEGSAVYGSTVTLTASPSHDATGVEYIYQWYKGSTAVSGQTGQTLSLSNVADSGSYTVKVKAKMGSETSGEAASDPVTVTISKANISPTVTLDGWTYGGTANSPSVTGNSGNGAVTYTYYTDSGCTTQTSAANGASTGGGQPKNAGTYYVKAAVAQTDNYNSAEAQTSFTISPKTVTLVWSNTSLVYTGAAQTPTVTVSGLCGSDTCTVTNITVTADGGSALTDGNAVNYGSYTAKATALDNSNYKLPTDGTISTEFQIIKADRTIEAPTAAAKTTTSVTLNAALPSAGGSDGMVEYACSTSNAAPSSDWQTSTAFTGLSLNVTYYFFARVTGGTNYNNATSNGTAITTSNKTAVTISGVSVENVTYDGQTHTGYIGTPAVIGHTELGDTLVYNYSGTTSGGSSYNSATAPKDAGSYTLTISVPDSNPTYTGSTAVSFAIGKRSLVVTADNKTAIVGSTMPELTYTLSGDGFVSGETWTAAPSLSCSPTMSAAGSYTITVSGAAASDNYTLTMTNGTLTVSNKIAVEISGVSVPGKIYDGLPASCTGTPSATAGGSTVTVSGCDYQWQKPDGSALSEAPRNAGDYKLVVSVPNSDPTYTGSATLSFTIGKAPLTISVIGKTAGVGDTLPTLSAADYVVEGLVGNDTLTTPPTLSYEPAPNMAVAGSTVINASGADAGGNYEIIYKSGLLTVTAANPKQYTVTFHTNGGSAVAVQTVSENTKAARPADPTKSGYVLLGWYQDSGCTTSWDFATGLVTRDTTLYAKWTRDTAAISGDVTDSNDQPVQGATVRIVQGTVELARTVTGSDGSYRIEGVPIPGTYNVIAEKDGVTKTILVTLTDEDAADQSITMPASQINSVLEVKGQDTPDVVVGGLDAEAEDKAQEGHAVTITMTVEEKAEEDAANADAIKTEAGADATLEFLEIKVEQAVDAAAATPVTETTTVLMIVIPFDFKNKDDIKVYRHHGTEVDELEEMNSGADGTYQTDTANGLIIVYTQKFSTYAIAYTQVEAEPAPTPLPSNSGSGSPTYPPTVETPEHGAVTVSPKYPGKNEKVTITVTPDEGYDLDILTIIGSDGKSVEYTDNGDGTYTFTQPRGKVAITATFRKASSLANCQHGESCPAHHFTDLDLSLWYHDGIHFCVERGLMVGTSGSTFEPGTTTSRAMIATILWRLNGSPVVNYALPYDDVAEDAWYTEAIRWATSAGVVAGYGNGKFGPDNPITREQLATMLYRYEQKINGGGFTDAWMFLLDFTDANQVSSWANEAMHYMVMHGVIAGKGNKLLDPFGKATRAEAAAMLQRYLSDAAK